MTAALLDMPVVAVHSGGSSETGSFALFRPVTFIESIARSSADHD